MILQLTEIIPVTTPLGEGYAIFLQAEQLDYWWTVALDNGAVVTFPQNRIRICRDYTHGRGISDEEMRRIIEPAQPRNDAASAAGGPAVSASHKRGL